jgi:hypothetical protein
LIKGNLPNFLRNLNPVVLKHAGGDGTLPTVVIFVTPDYMAIGSDNDFLRIPMNRHTASHIATSFGSILPTTKMVDAIYATADYHLRPRPMTPGPDMRSTAYYRTHNRLVDKQCADVGVINGEIVSGHKKDVVFTNQLKSRPHRLAIYGWHRSDGRPIQPLSYVHGATYADYSHGIRLVSDIVLINGRPRSIFEALSDTRLAGVLSNEGPFKIIRANTKRIPNLAKQ